MSVCMLFYAGKECLAEVPVATEATFLQYWDPIIKELCLPLLGKWNGYLSLGREGAPALIREIQKVASISRERFGDDVGCEMTNRADRAVSAIQKYLEDDRITEISFG